MGGHGAVVDNRVVGGGAGLAVLDGDESPRENYLFFKVKANNQTLACMFDPANPKPIFETLEGDYGETFRTVEKDQLLNDKTFYWFNNRDPSIKLYIVNAKNVG